jgi:hypothetical protein
MKKYLAFIAVLALSLGCAITNYPVITDTYDCKDNFVVDTQGKALIVPTTQVITIWPDRNDELFTMVDQKHSGDQTLWTYNNVCYGEPKFMGYTYCNPDWTGCPILVADNPIENDVVFDYTMNPNCLGAASLSVLVSYNQRTMECGRGMLTPGIQWAKLDLMYPIGENFGILLTRDELTINALHSDGSSSNIPVSAIAATYYPDPHGWAVRMTPSMATTMRAMAQSGARKYEVCLLDNCINVDMLATQNMLKNADF